MLEEVEAVIKRLKWNKSLGTGGIVGEAIQAGGIRLAKEIHKVCEKAWRESRFPEKWTRSILVTMPRKGDLMQCDNYRTIALMILMCKEIMMILLERLKPQVEAHLAEEQVGFRSE